MKTLPFGTFNGERRSSIDLNGFLLAEFVDRPEDTITRHTHEDTHFQFLLKGLYITSAVGLDALCDPPAVIFNPAGTTHRDRFHTRGGSFLALSVSPGVMARIGDSRVLEERAVGFSGGEVLWLGGRLRQELRQCDELSPIVIEAWRWSYSPTSPAKKLVEAGVLRRGWALLSSKSRIAIVTS
jgi:AraC family transcriptional regulator